MNNDMRKKIINLFNSEKLFYLVLYLIGTFLPLFLIFTILTRNGFKYSDTVFSILVFGVLFFWIYRTLKKEKISINEFIGDVENINWGKIFYLNFILLFFSLFASSVYQYFLAHFLPSVLEKQLQPYQIFYESGGFVEIIFNLILIFSIVFLAPVVEELFFRGYLLYKLRLKINLKFAIVVSSIFFAILHQNILGTFVFAVVMAFIYIKSNSLLIPMIVHSINNALAIFLSILLRNVPTEPKEAEVIIEEIKNTGGTSLVFFAIFYF
jgi:hypothetical protein